MQYHSMKPRLASLAALLLAGTPGCGAYLLELPAVARIVVAPPGAPLAVGESLQLRATALGRDGSVVRSTRVVVSWSVSDAAVAAVDSLSGRVVARAPGTAIVRARWRGNADSVTVRVVPGAR
jgi:hypothetical protein